MRRLWSGTIVMAASWIFSIASYSSLPPEVAIHWNLQFEANGHASRFVAAVLIPTFFLATPLIALVLRRIDPRARARDEEADGAEDSAYWSIYNYVLIALAAVQFVIVALGRGWNIDGARLFPAIIGGLFIALGNESNRLRPNWFVGFRTPWSLTSDEVWRKTHRVAARCSIAAGALLIAGAIFESEALRSVLWVVAFVLFVSPLVYSYFVWRNEGRAPSGG